MIEVGYVVVCGAGLEGRFGGGLEGGFGGGYAIGVGCGGGGGYGNGGRHGFQLHFSIAKNRLEHPTFLKIFQEGSAA